MTEIPRESVEFVAVTVLVDGSPAIGTEVELSVARITERPTTWAQPVQLDGKVGLLTGDYDAGSYTVWARVTAGGIEQPVVNCGRLTIT